MSKMADMIPHEKPDTGTTKRHLWCCRKRMGLLPKAPLELGEPRVGSEVGLPTRGSQNVWAWQRKSSAEESDWWMWLTFNPLG